MKKANIFVASLGLFLGIIGSKFGFTFPLFLIAFFVLFAIIVSDYQKATYAMVFFVVIDYFFRNYISSIGGIWDDLLLIVLVFVWLYKWFRYRDIADINTTPLDFPLIVLYCVCAFLLLVNSPDLKISIDGARVVAQFTLWYFLAIQLLKSKKDVRVFLLAFVLMGTALGLHGVYQYIARVPMPASWLDSVEYGIRTRVFSIIGSPNLLGCLMTLISPIALAFMFAEKKLFKKLFFLCCSLLMIGCLIFTYSRGAWIAFAVAIALYTLLKDKRLFVPVIIIFLVAAVFVPSISSRIAYMLSPEYLASSMRGGRVARWLNGIIMVRNAPLFGVGLGHFGGAVAMNYGIRDTFYMDNYYLKTAVEMGFVGLITFVGLMLSVFNWSLRTVVNLDDPYYKELAIGIFSGLVGVMVHNFFENIFEDPGMITCFWVLVAFIMYLYYAKPLRYCKKNNRLV